MDRLTQYINDALQELRHVRWPTRQQAVRLSLIVIAFSAVCAVAFGGIDYLFSLALKFLLTHAS